MSHEEWLQHPRRWPDSQTAGQHPSNVDVPGGTVPGANDQALGLADTGLGKAYLHDHFAKSVSTLRRRNQKLSHAMNIMTLQQSQTHNGWDMCSSTRGHYENSQEKLYQAMIDNSFQTDPFVVALQAQVDKDRGSLVEQSIEVKAREARMIAVEDRAHQRAKSFMAAVDHFMSLLQLVPSDPSTSPQHLDAESVDGSLPDTVAEEVLDPELEEYYDEEGNVKILGERLVDLDMTFAEASIARDLQRDQELIPEDTDEGLQATYLDERSTLERQIDVAIAEAARLKRACLAKGILPSNMVYTTSSPAFENASDQREFEAHTTNIEPPPLASRSHSDACALSFTGRLDGSSSPKRRHASDAHQVNRTVAEWVASVSFKQRFNEPLLVEDPTKFRSPDRARRSLIEPRSKSDACFPMSASNGLRGSGVQPRPLGQEGLIRFSKAHSSA